MAAEFPKLKRPTLILVTGLHDSLVHDKSKLIARWAWLLHETILDAMSEGAGCSNHLDAMSEEEAYYRGNNRNFPAVGEEEASRLQRVSFEATCWTALSILSHSPPMECVVISTSLVFHKSHLLGLLYLMQQGYPGRRRLLIIECLTKGKFSWQRSVERAVSRRSLRWYEAKSWNDVENTILRQQRQGIDPYFRHLFGHTTPSTIVDVIKLLIDPFYDFGPRDYDASINRPGLGKGSLFIEAMKELLTCEDVNDYGETQGHVVNYGVWRRHRLDELGRSFNSRVTADNNWCASPGDCVFRFRYNFAAAAAAGSEEKEASICEICGGKISCNTEPAYFCQFCSLCFHPSCCHHAAEATTTTHSMEMLLSEGRIAFDSVKCSCYSCIKESKEFLEECDLCVYRTLIKSKVVSPLLQHDSDQQVFSAEDTCTGESFHLLSVGVRQGHKGFWCDACQRVDFISRESGIVAIFAAQYITRNACTCPHKLIGMSIHMAGTSTLPTSTTLVLLLLRDTNGAMSAIKT